MTNENLCFCLSGKPYADCHGYINEKSMIAKLYTLQHQIDTEIEKQRVDNELVFTCRPGCCECCSYCFCVSETEFVQILDRMFHEWHPDEIDQIVRASRQQWETLVAEAPDIAERITGRTTISELWRLHQITLPFPCVFLDSEGRCRIHDIRPLSCRIHGIGFISMDENSRPCSKQPPVLTAWNKYVDLIAFREDISALTLLNDGQHLIVRRALPLFYYFTILFDRDRKPDDIRQSLFYRNLIEIDKDEYIGALIRYKQNKGKE